MKKTFLLFLLAFMVLIVFTIASVIWLPFTYKIFSAWFIILIMIPIAGYTWRAFIRLCHRDNIKTTSPFLYTLGILFSPPQGILGLIFMIAGSYFLYPLLINHSLQGIIKIIVFLVMMTFGSTWLINALASRYGTPPHSSTTPNNHQD